MERSDEVDELNEALKGSPYLLDDDDAGRALASALASDTHNLRIRSRLVEESFQSGSANLRGLIDAMTGARVVYESNALEGLGLSLAETKREIDPASSELRSAGDLGALRTYILKRGLLPDPHFSGRSRAERREPGCTRPCTGLSTVLTTTPRG